jgi:hypothetical protein
MHFPCGQAYGFGITAIIITPEEVFTGFTVKISLTESDLSTNLKISLFLGRLERE